MKKGFYVDILIDDKWNQGYIKEEKQNNKYDVIYLSLPNKILIKSNISNKALSFFGDNYYEKNNYIREVFLDKSISELEIKNLYDLLLYKLKEINIDFDIIEKIVSKIEDNQNYNMNIIENYENSFEKENEKYKIDRNNNKINITGFYTYQFFSGFFVDVIIFINYKLEYYRLSSIKQSKKDLIFDDNFEKLINSVLSIIIFLLVLGQKKIFIIKNNIIFNRKNIIIDKICSILSSIEIIISNCFLMNCYEYLEYPNIEIKLKIICCLCYEIILSNGENNNFLPIQFLTTLINFIIYEDNIIRIENFDRNKVYKSFLKTLQMINGDDIKYIKKFSDIKVYCSTIIKKLYKGEKKVLINNCYYSFLVNSLTKCNILEKKILALNCINDIILDLLESENELNIIFKDFFINKNKIMNIFFEETVHDEILKRSIEFFKYLSFYDCLNEELLEKLIKLSNCNTIRNILCEIIKNFKNINKKDQLFKNITKKLNFDNNDNSNNIIEFVSKLTLACFSSNENNQNDIENDLTNGNSSIDASLYNKNIINENINESRRISINIQILKTKTFTKNKTLKKKFSKNVSNNSLEKLLLNSPNNKKGEKKKRSPKNNIFKKIIKKNYYGLDLLFNYIIFSYNEKKAIINNNNITKAIKSFKFILDSTGAIKVKDIHYFLDKLLENIISNKKNNSIVQSLILIEILLNKLLSININKNNNIYNIAQNSNFIFNNINQEEGEIIYELDNKYNIISLITNDLIRYVSKVENVKKSNDNFNNEIFEGIYPYMNNISIRLKLLFLFINFGLLINDEEHIIKIYSLFNSEKYEKEKILFVREIAENIEYINYETLKNIFSKIFQNNSLFDKSTFKDVNSLKLIKQLFININIYNESLIYDSKAIKVNLDLNKLEGIDYLFDILISNKNHFIQNKLCKLLTKCCLFLSNYKKDFCSKYWNNYIKKITDLMKKCNKNKNTIGILGLVQLIEYIYSFNFSLRIPTKEETHVAQEPYELFHFCCEQRENKDYKLRVGKKDKILHMRWKLAYYYDIRVNDLVICDKDKNMYNFTYDDLEFYDIFPPRKYLFGNGKFVFIKVFEMPDQLLKIPNNPNELIEKNETIINILIDNLNNKDEANENIEENKNDDFLMKKKIWNIMQKLPKKKYIEKAIKQYGVSDVFEYEELIKRFNVNEIYILAFNLQCILNYLNIEQEKENNNKDKIKELNHFLDIFINFHHIDRIIYNDFMSINMNKNNISDRNYNFIYFECVKYLLELIQIIEEYKIKKTLSFNLNSINRDKETIQTKFEFVNSNKDDLDSTKENFSLILKDTISEVIGNKLLYNKITEIIGGILNDSSSSNELICPSLLLELISFMNQMNNNYSVNNSINNLYKNYFDFLLENVELFKKIFIFDYIKCPKEEVKRLINNFLTKNLFNNFLNAKSKIKNKEKDNITNRNNNNLKYLKKYFDIVLTPEMFNYLVTNQKNGSYFILISSIIDKFLNYSKKLKGIKNILDLEDEEDNNYKINFEKIVDCIIKHFIAENNNNNINSKNNSNNQNLLSLPYKNDSSLISIEANSNLHKINNNENSSLINGILSFLLKVLELSSISQNSAVDYFLDKIDICDFLILKGILNKSNEKSLYINDNFFNNPNSHKIIFQIIIFLVKNIDNKKNIINENNYIEDSLYMKIWKTLNKYHKLEFWRKNQNFEIESIDCNRKEFIGLKNMSSTCYMNSILQQFFMIPMLRETILTIGDDNINKLKQNTVLYQLKLLFASLKTYDFKYYNPKKFVIASKLSFFEQMDADEYYGQLIDRLENDISDLYNKDKDKNKYIDLFKYFFGIKLTDELYFIECDHKRFNESFCYNIQLEVKNFSNIKDSLKNYFKMEKMTGDNKINCEECNTKRVCHKQLKIKNLPNILFISLKRFDYDYRIMKKFKLNNYFEFPFKLDMSEYLINSNNNDNNENNTNENNNLYELTGITIHYGVSDYGHYYDIIKAENNKWYIFNDTNIKEFPEKDIPKEAFGEREANNDLDEEMTEKACINQKDKKNAYILIYTKKTFKNNFTKNNEYKTKLIFPPYDKFSNINNNMKSYINYKMFKYWTIENLSNSFYQSFIIELLKIDLVKNIHKEIDKAHKSLIETLKEEEYLPIKKYINTGTTIFSFGLLYFCNVLIKIPKEKNNYQIYMEMLTIYLENDINKCLYILEEFSDIEIIEEFFINNKNNETVNSISELIIISFNNYILNSEDKENEVEHNNLNLFKFLNSLILFISNKANVLCSNINSLDNIVDLFCKLINKKQIFLKYLKNKGIAQWLDEIINKINNDNKEIAIVENVDEDEQVKMNFLLTNDNFPRLESAHCILKEKTNDFNFDINLMKTQELENIENNNNSPNKEKKIGVTRCDSIVLLRRLKDDIKELS